MNVIDHLLLALPQHEIGVPDVQVGPFWVEALTVASRGASFQQMRGVHLVTMTKDGWLGNCQAIHTR